MLHVKKYGIWSYDWLLGCHLHYSINCWPRHRLSEDDDDIGEGFPPELMIQIQPLEGDPPLDTLRIAEVFRTAVYIDIIGPTRALVGFTSQEALVRSGFLLNSSRFRRL